MGRHALLIGTSTYDDRALENLPGVRHDLDQLSTVLNQVGQFDTVDVALDGTREQLADKIETFYQDRKTGDLALFYYSGHGLVASDTDGSLFLAAANSTRDGALHSGAVDVDGMLRHLLNTTRADEKVVLLDCCFSGRFELRGQVHSGVRRSVRRGVRQTGTFLLTATTQRNAAKTQGPDRPSVFTGLVLDGLRGLAARDGQEWITTNDLARYVHSAAKARPMESSEGVTEPIKLVVTEERAAVRTSAGVRVRRAGDDAELDADHWRRLIEYYVTCLERSAVLGSFVDVAQSKSYAVAPAGPEQFFAGPTGGQVTEKGLVSFARRTDQDAQLRYGYPVVMLPGKRAPRFSPLMVSDVTLASDGRLLTQPPAFNRAVGAELQLSDLEIDDLAQQVQETLVPGDRRSLDETVRRLLEILGLQAAGAMSADNLLGSLPRGPVQRVHNAAVLFAADPTDGAQQMLLSDLRDLKKQAGDLSATALGVLSDGPQAGSDDAAVEIISPVRLNEAQEEIVRAAMSRRLTVAQGPPGTGKSQLVTALVATAENAGQTVLVGSTNNRAVEEVVQRIQQTVGPGLLVRTGNKEQLAQEPHHLAELLKRFGSEGMTDISTSAADLRVLEQEIAGLRGELDERRSCEATLAVLGVERAAGEPVTLPDPELDRAWSWARRASRPGLLGWWWRRRLRTSYGVTGPEAVEEIGSRLETEIQWRAAARTVSGLRDEATVWRRLCDLGANQRPALAQQLLLARTSRRVQNGKAVLEERIRKMSAPKPRSWVGFRPLLTVLPGWATTTMSARNLQPHPGLFDLVIIDEAAQCSIPTLLPMLLRAKRALIIGDPHQLSPVITLPPAEDARLRDEAGLTAGWLENRSLGYSSDTGYDAFAKVAGSTFLLDEHYRCHPEIIGPPNRFVYQDKLTVLTDPSMLRVRNERAVDWRHVAGEFVPGASGSGGRNEPEVAAVVAEVAEQLAAHPDATIGVVTPLAAQARLLDRALRNQHLMSDRVLLGTIHRFQGGERDIMVMSPTGAGGIQPRTQQWLVGQTNLWNVAITRARSKLVVVGDRGWWEAQRGLLPELLSAGHSEAVAARGSVRAADALQAAFRRAARPVVRDVSVAGRVYDLAVDENILIHVDDPNGDPDGRALRRLLAWADIAPPGTSVHRVPVWRCITEPDAVVAEVTGRVS